MRTGGAVTSGVLSGSSESSQSRNFVEACPFLGGDITQKSLVEPLQLKAGGDKYFCSAHSSLWRKKDVLLSVLSEGAILHGELS